MPPPPAARFSREGLCLKKRRCPALSRKEPTVPPSGSLFPPAWMSPVLAARGECSPSTPFFFEAKPLRADRRPDLDNRATGSAALQRADRGCFRGYFRCCSWAASGRLILPGKRAYWPIWLPLPALARRLGAVGTWGPPCSRCMGSAGTLRFPDQRARTRCGGWPGALAVSGWSLLDRCRRTPGC